MAAAQSLENRTMEVDPVYEVDAPKFFDFDNMEEDDGVGDSWFEMKRDAEIETELEQREIELSHVVDDEEEEGDEEVEGCEEVEEPEAPQTQEVEVPTQEFQDRLELEERTEAVVAEEPEVIPVEETPMQTGNEAVSSVPERQSGGSSDPPMDPTITSSHQEEENHEPRQEELERRGRARDRKVWQKYGTPRRTNPPKTTKPKEFTFLSDMRIVRRRSRSLQRLAESQESLNSKPATPKKPAIALPRQAPRTNTVVVPFSFDRSDSERRKEAENRAMAERLKATQPQPQIHRLPPKSKPMPVFHKEKKVIPPTVPVPFNFVTDKLLAVHKKNHEPVPDRPMKTSVFNARRSNMTASGSITNISASSHDVEATTSTASSGQENSGRRVFSQIPHLAKKYPPPLVIKKSSKKATIPFTPAFATGGRARSAEKRE